MTERDNEAAYQRKVSEARRIVDDEMRWIMRENPKANPELCAKLFYEEAKNDRKLAAAAMLAAAASISEDVVREQQARKRKLRRPWPLLRGLAHLARSCRPGRHPFCVRPGASDRLHVRKRPVGEVRESARDQGVGLSDVPLVLGAKVRVLREVLEHLAHLMGARVEAVIDGRGHLQHLQLCPCAFSVPTKSLKE